LRESGESRTQQWVIDGRRTLRSSLRNEPYYVLMRNMGGGDADEGEWRDGCKARKSLTVAASRMV
jgi:hypothetical protein